MRFLIADLLANRPNYREIADVWEESQKYSTWSPDTVPPILVRESDLWILDGHHRTAAAMIRGNWRSKAGILRRYL